VPTKETVLLPKDLLDADECFITNTTMEIMPVTTIGKKALGRGRPGPVTVLLRQAYQYEVLTCLKT